MHNFQNFSLDTTIIPQNESRVKWSEKKEKNLIIAKKLLKISQLLESKADFFIEAGQDGEALNLRSRAELFKKRSYRMKECSRFITISICPDCNRSIGSSATLCRDRVCPTCAWRLSAKQSAEMLSTLSYINDLSEYDALFLTLTVQNCECNQLAPTLEMLSKGWNKLLARKKNRELIKGSAKSVEITYNKKTHTFHPHYHIILLIDKNSKNIGELNAYFNKEWKSAINVLYTPITDLRKIENRTLTEYNKTEAELYKKAILETFKYTIKDDTLADMPISDFRFYVDGIQGKRLVSYTGIIKEARNKLEFEDELEDETGVKHCPDCSGEMLSAIYQWSYNENTYKRFIDNVQNA